VRGEVGVHDAPAVGDLAVDGVGAQVEADVADVERLRRADRHERERVCVGGDRRRARVEQAVDEVDNAHRPLADHLEGERVRRLDGHLVPAGPRRERRALAEALRRPLGDRQQWRWAEVAHRLVRRRLALRVPLAEQVARGRLLAHAHLPVKEVVAHAQADGVRGRRLHAHLKARRVATQFALEEERRAAGRRPGGALGGGPPCLGRRAVPLHRKRLRAERVGHSAVVCVLDQVRSQHDPRARHAARGRRHLAGARVGRLALHRRRHPYVARAVLHPLLALMARDGRADDGRRRLVDAVGRVGVQRQPLDGAGHLARACVDRPRGATPQDRLVRVGTRRDRRAVHDEGVRARALRLDATEADGPARARRARRARRASRGVRVAGGLVQLEVFGRRAEAKAHGDGRRRRARVEHAVDAVGDALGVLADDLV
jgi:hypothetical protein